jgi:hypothetical protein
MTWSPGLEKEPGHAHECNARVRDADATALGLSIQANRCVLLELLRLNAQVWLGGVERFGSRTKALLFQNREQIPKMSELGPVVHAKPLLKGWSLQQVRSGHYGKRR